jgi:alkanesulfonate monooxygenase SsuD/methylene tetrahydromethanopterin reductase-like flavin-dependent oxidoreductase (luciferase family)
VRIDFVPFFHPGENIPWNQTVDMMREQTKLGEQAGFTTVWLTEHHFAHNGYLNATPNPILMCADLGARFSKIRLGQAPVVLPDWHPLRVAEDIALLDNMTEGRVDFGVARGTNERTCVQFNIDADKRDDKKSYALFRESLDIITRAWTEDPFSYKGDFYTFPVPGWHETNRMFEPLDKRYHAEDGEYIGMYVHPRPYQQPHPPVWLMSNAPFSYEFAARNGYGVIAVMTSKNNILACWDAYKATTKKSLNKTLTRGQGVGLCVTIYVADTMEQAAKDIRPAINLYYQFLSGARTSGNGMRQAYLEKGQVLTDEEMNCDWFDFLMTHEVIWVGTASYVAEKIAKYQEELNMQHLMLVHQFPGIPFQKIMASMSKFSENVAPRFS